MIISTFLFSSFGLASKVQLKSDYFYTMQLLSGFSYNHKSEMFNNNRFDS